MLRLLRFVLVFGVSPDRAVRVAPRRTALQAVDVGQIAEGPTACWLVRRMPKNGDALDTGVYTDKLVAKGALKKNQHQLMSFPEKTGRIGPLLGFRRGGPPK